ncbi:MAG: hypothetical protein WBN44_00295, partial [Woeseiaceae bacterium]
MKISSLIILSLSVLMLGACGGADRAGDAAPVSSTTEDEISVTATELEGNPFMEEWTTPYGVPPFASIENGHYMP